MIRLISRLIEAFASGWHRSLLGAIGARWGLAVGVFLATAFLLSAQQPGQAQVPTLEAKLTRIFAAEAPTQIRFPSLSPNGRWILFSTSGTYPQVTRKGLGLGLWLVPAAGGKPIQLTRGGYFDDGPVWFPSGDRIAFKSPRPARGGNGGEYVMTLAIDPETGQPEGPPRQVSTERCFGYLDVAPDGESIAFSAWSGTEKALLVVPAVGGSSRMVARAMTRRPAWSPDGSHIYYTVGIGEGEGQGLVRVSLHSAESDTVVSWPGEIYTGSSGTRFVLRETSSMYELRNHPSAWEVATLDGDVLGRMELPPSMSPHASFTPGGELLAVRLEGEAPLEVLPIDGGSPRRLSETGARDQVLGWSPDGRRVLFKTALDGKDRYFFAPVEDGPMEEVRPPEDPLPSFPPVLSTDGRHLLYAVNGPHPGRSQLNVFDLEDGDIRVATEDVFLPDPMSFELSGRGGVLWRDGEEFLFVRREGDRFEIRAVSPDGPSRILRTFQGALPGSMAVRGDWIAFSHVENPNTPEAKASVMLARAGDGPARAILTLQGVLESFAWSPDGNRLALGTYPMEPDRPPPSWGLQLLVLEIDSSGQVMGEPSLLDAPEGFWSWSPRWLPDGRGLLVQGEDGNVWQISSQPGVRPMEVTEALPPNNEVWDFHVSPDGRFIAYARGIFRGSSIWRVDLGDALSGWLR
jgi:Tol biopolymer transport system component